MNKQEIIKKVEKSGLKFKVVISSVSALVLHGVIEETKIDKVECYVKDLYYNSLKKELIEEGYEFKPTELGEGYIEYEGMHIHFNKNAADNEYYIKTETFICFASLDDILKEYKEVKQLYKTKYEKYTDRCEMLEEFMNKHNKNLFKRG